MNTLNSTMLAEIALALNCLTTLKAIEMQGETGSSLLYGDRRLQPVLTK